MKRCYQQLSTHVTNGLQKTALSCQIRLLSTSPPLVRQTISPYIIITSISEDRNYKDQKVEFWNNVYGFDMSIMKDVVVREPLVDTCDPAQLVCKRSTVKVIDLYKVCWFFGILRSKNFRSSKRT